MILKMTSAAVVGIFALAATSAQAEITMFEPVKKSMEDLLNEGYSISSQATDNGGDLHFLLHGSMGKKAVLCILKPNGVNKETISKCKKLN